MGETEPLEMSPFLERTDMTEFSCSRLDELRNELDNICTKIADKFDFYYFSGGPRIAAIIDILGSTPNVEDIIDKFQRKNYSSIDAIYLENHKLAVGILVERLYSYLGDNGYNVSFFTEAKLKHGTIDVLLSPTNYGVNLQHNGQVVVIEVKTGKSISYSQLFRYMLDASNVTMILWRLKHRQVSVFHKKDLLPLLQAFLDMCILRGERVLSIETYKCSNSNPVKSFNLSSINLERTINDFSDGLVETLPVVLKTVIRELRSDLV